MRIDVSRPSRSIGNRRVGKFLRRCQIECIVLERTCVA